MKVYMEVNEMKVSHIANLVSGSKQADLSQNTAATPNIAFGEVGGQNLSVKSTEGGSVDQQRPNNQSREEVTEAEADRRMKSVIDQANEKVRHTGNRQLAFSYNENTKRISIKVYDAVTKEIIREIPPEKTLEMLERVYDLAGIMVDEKR